MRTLAILLTCLGLLSATPATAKPSSNPTLGQVERQIILRYYQQLADEQYGGHSHRAEHGHGHGHHVAHGHNGRLPPGIARNLERGKPLPPGIAAHRLPDSLQTRLPPPPKGYQRVVLDGRVLLIDIATRVIRDKLEDVLIRD